MQKHRRPALLVALASATLAMCQGTQPSAPRSEDDPAPLPTAEPGKSAVATFAGGCFWCMETAFEGIDGVLAVTSGYTGGKEQNPTYEEVSSHATGHAEAVQVLFDPARIGYEKLLEIFWHNVDPTTVDRQFCDAGPQYRSEIFVQDAEQRKLAEESRRKIEATKTFKETIVTPITDATQFWPAEGYHQDFYKKNPTRYHGYRTGCGRDARLKEIWGASAGHP